MHTNLALWSAILIATSGCISAGHETVPTSPMPHYAALILPTPYTTIRAVFHATSEFEPTSFAITHLVAEAERAIGKPLHAENGHPLPPWARVERNWSAEDLRRLAREVPPLDVPFGEYGRGNEAVIGVYYLLGHYDGTNLGTSIENRLFVMAGSDRGQALHSSPHVGERIERHTLIHEFGHALGLVNCGIPMVTPHEDASSRCHSKNYDSVMGIYYLSDPRTLLNDSWAPWQFDADDLADIAAYREAHS